MFIFYYAVILIVSSLSFITVNFEFCCRLWIDNRQLEFTTDYGLIIGSYGFYYRLWIENLSGCKLSLAAERGIISENLIFFLLKIGIFPQKSEFSENLKFSKSLKNLKIF